MGAPWQKKEAWRRGPGLPGRGGAGLSNNWPEAPAIGRPLSLVKEAKPP